MKCNGCGTSMLLDRAEHDGQASTCWHRCPLCKKVRLISSPGDEVDLLHGTPSGGPPRSAYADDYDPNNPDSQENTLYV